MFYFIVLLWLVMQISRPQGKGFEILGIDFPIVVKCTSVILNFFKIFNLTDRVGLVENVAKQQALRQAARRRHCQAEEGPPRLQSPQSGSRVLSGQN